MSDPSASSSTYRRPLASSSSGQTISSTFTTSNPLPQTTRTPPRLQYLLLYNASSLFLWLVVMSRVGSSLLTSYPSFTLFSSSSTFIRLTQSLAVLEVLHAAVGLVRASPATTGLQVLSRLLLVWWVAGRYGHVVRHQLAWVSMVAAWSITEVVRYVYFVFALASESGFGGKIIGREQSASVQPSGTQSIPKALVWLRYNFFFVLYPVGIASECYLIWKSTDAAMSEHFLLGWLHYAILAIYIPGSYVLYTHMMTQRRRVIRGKQRATH